MYVCSCNGYRDAEIRAAASAGVRCARQAFRLLGGEPRCGRCLEVAQSLIDESRVDVIPMGRSASGVEPAIGS